MRTFARASPYTSARKNPLRPDDLVRGQYAGYRKEPDVAKNSDVETFCALHLFFDSWRWEGVPWCLRSGQMPRGNGNRGSGRTKASALEAFRRFSADDRP